MRLNDSRIRAQEPKAKPFKLSDGDGLYLLIQPNGAKWWRFYYRFHGRPQTISFGVYPDVPLKLARERRQAAREQVAAGKNPSAIRREEARRASGDTFEIIAREYLQTQRKRLAEATRVKLNWLLESFLLPRLGSVPIRTIEPPELLAVLRAIEAPGRNESAHRAKQLCGQVFRYGIATGRAVRDPSADLRGALVPVVVTNRAAVTTPKLIRDLLHAIDAFEGTPIVGYALQFLALTFVRPGELRHAEWDEIDWESALWRIPARKMKMRDDHLVPLSAPAVKILKLMQPLSKDSRYVFRSVRSRLRPMSNNTLNAALRRLGYDKTMATAHGFRAMASTRLNELGFPQDVIERQLAHRERNQVRAVYNRAQYLPERIALMDRWAEELERLRSSRQ